MPDDIRVGTGDEVGRPVLEVRDAVVDIGGIKALGGVALTITAGNLYGIVGPNGSGKSTLLAAISRLRALTSGDIFLAGRNVTNVSPEQISRSGLARTFQTVRLMPEYSVFENVKFGADFSVYGSFFFKQWMVPWWSRAKEAQVRERAQNALERLGLMDVREELPSNLSYGFQRKVEIARALASHPNLILLDEPTAGMNHTERDQIAQLLVQLRDEGVTQVLVEHDLKMMLDICSYFYVLESGQLIAQGLPKDCVREPSVIEAYLGRRPSD